MPWPQVLGEDKAHCGSPQCALPPPQPFWTGENGRHRGNYRRLLRKQEAVAYAPHTLRVSAWAAVDWAGWILAADGDVATEKSNVGQLPGSSLILRLGRAASCGRFGRKSG